MSLLGMPWAMVNLGCEMVYILHQRLNAQGIPADKAVKVLQDIIKTMLEPGFLSDKLFVPQDMYSLASTRKVFDRIAHSSIMKLSENSMDKLFDLMVMGAKYCLMCSTQLDDMLQVTIRHLKSACDILTSAAASSSPAVELDATVPRLLSNAEQATMKFYGNLPAGELLLLRSTLARYFQDKRVRVSLFLAEGIQLQSGKLVMPSCINDRVGLVRSFDADGSLESEERVQMASQQVNPNEFLCHPVALGDNLYRKDRPKVVPPFRAGDAGANADKQQLAHEQQLQQQQQTEPPTTGTGGGSECGRYQRQDMHGAPHQAAQELDFLAHLVHVAQPAAADNFKLNLFLGDGDGDHDAAQQHAQPSGKPSKQQYQELQFGANGKNEGYIKALGDVLEAVQLEEDEALGGKGVGDDLLDLMDSVA